LKVLFLGVGGWISKPILGHTSILVVSSRGGGLLLDAGEDVVRSLYFHGFKVHDLESVVITHLHGDHVLGLPTLLMFAKHYEKVSSLRVYAPRESVSDLDALLRIVGVDYTGVATLLGVSPGSNVNVGDFTLYFERAVHPVPALSLKIMAEGRCIVYSGDTAYNPALVRLAENCDLLIHEASGHHEDAHLYGHSNVGDAVRVAVESGSRKLILVHYYVDTPALRAPLPEGLEVYLAYPGYELFL